MKNDAIRPQIAVDPRILKQNPWNPNQVDPINQEKLRESLKQTGFYRPIVIRTLNDDSLEIIGGAHRVTASIELGYKEIPAINLGRIGDVEAKRITLLDNSQYGETDFNKMAEILSEIGTTDEILSILPIDDAELAGYFEHDLDAQLDALNDMDTDDDPGDEIDLGIKEKPTKTHEIMRFKVPIDDAELIKERIKTIGTDQGFTESDSLTNAGDCLVWLMKNDA